MNCGDARFRQKLYVCVYVGVVELTSALTSHLMDSKSCVMVEASTIIPTHGVLHVCRGK